MIFNLVGKGGGADVSGVTASAGDVLTGKDFVNSSGTLVHGSMTNRGDVTATIDGITTITYTIQQGYHNGSGTVSLTDDIEDELDDILNGSATVTVLVEMDGVPSETTEMITGNGTYAIGDTCSLQALSDTDYFFDSWIVPKESGGVHATTENPYVFTVTKDITITAVYWSV